MNTLLHEARVPRFVNASFALFTFSLLLALSVLSLLGPARASFQMQAPPNLVTISSGLRNNVFLVGQPVTFALSGTAAVRYEVRDYWGNIVDSGLVSSGLLTPSVSLPGWYKLNLFGSAPQSPWGYSVGGTTFVIYRNDPHFPVVQSPLVGANTGSEDEVMRAVSGLGPQRHSITDATQPAASLAALTGSIALDKQYYLGFNDPLRPRDLLLNFPNGGTNTAGVTQIVGQLQNDVHYYEARNEPNFAVTGAGYAAGEMKTFYQTVKSVNPSLKVLGPGVVSLNPGMLTWMDSFFAAGGGNYIDGISFHAYNAVNGDLSLARTSLNGLNALLAKYGQDKKEKWQTEQGYMAAVYGAYEPRHQGRWTMLQMMVFEQYGLTKEHNHLWYDVSHGFWDQPMFTENSDGSLNPAAPLMRVWSEELYGTQFALAYDLGPTGNKMYLGSLFQGPGKAVAAFMSAGGTDGQLVLQVQGGSSLHVVSAFGVASDLPVTGGQVTLPVPEIPVYVELASGQTITPVPLDWGPNLATLPGATAQASGQSASPLDPTINNDVNKVHNGVLENWYYTQGPNDHPWMSNVSQFPATVEVDLPAQFLVGKVAIYCPVPWQAEGSLLDYELQYDNNGQWVTIDHTVEDPKTFVNYSASPACSVDSFYSDRCLFTHQFAPVTTGKIRLLVHDCTWGGGATQDVVAAGSLVGPHQFSVREIEVYPPAATGPVTAPSISLATPTNGSTVITGTAVPVTASVQAGTNPILRVDFFANGVPIGTATSSPYTVPWTPVTATKTVLTAVVTDTAGYSAASAPSTVCVTLPSAGPGQARFFPRSGYAGRLVGGRFQGSSDNVSYTDLAVVTASPIDGQWTAVPLSADPAGFRYLRYLSPSGSYGDVAEVEFDTGSGASATKLTGTPFGSPGSYGNLGSTFDKALDGSTSTFFDGPGPDGNYAGIDRGTGVAVAPPVVSAGQVRFFPRLGYAVRMQGGRFQGSNDGVGYTDLYTIPYAAADGQWTVAPLPVDPATYRYLRYLSPPGSYGDVAEVEFDTGSGTSATKLTGTGFGSPGSYGGSGATFDKALDGSTSTFFDAPTADGNFTGIDRGGTTPVTPPVTTPNLPPSVSLTAPTAGATVTTGVGIPLTAAASDSDGTVAQVAFYAGATLVGTATAAPYTVGWTPTAAGPVSLTAVATDNLGATTTSAAVSVMVAAPTVTPPAASPGQVRFMPRAGGYAARMVGGRFQGSSDNVSYTDLYTVTAAPTDGQWTVAPLSADPSTFRYLRYLSPPGSYGNVAEVEFDTGSGTSAVKLTGTGFGSPGSYGNSGATFDKALDGNGATFFDAPGPNGNFTGIDRGGTTPVTPPVITPNLPPSVSLTAPTTGSSATVGTAVSLTSIASDSDGTVAQVAFYAGNTLVGTVSAAPYSVNWTPATSGPISLTAVATDNLGATTTSAAVSVMVAAPTVTPPAASPGQVRFMPRAGGYGTRMIGGRFQGSNDGVGYTDLYTISSLPSDGQLTTAPLTVDPATYRYLRYLCPSGSYGNVAEVEFDTGSGTSAVKLTGTGFGSPGSYGNTGATFDKALDGNPATFFDGPGPDGNFTGIDRGGTTPVTPPAPSPGQVRYMPRAGGYGARMVGGRFQGSNDGTNYTDLYTISSLPTDGQWTASPLSVDPSTFRYLRYLSPPGSYGNVAEVEFDTGSGAGAVKVTGTGFGSPGSYGNSGATFDKALDGNGATFFDAPTSDGNFTGIVTR